MIDPAYYKPVLYLSTGGIALAMLAFELFNLRKKPMSPYALTPEDRSEIDNRFTFHPPNDSQIERYMMIRDRLKEVAILICENAPKSRELSTCLTHLDHAMMMANAAIARNEHG